MAKYKIRTFNPAKNAVYLLRKYQYHIHKKGFYHNSAAKLYYKKLFSTYNIFIRSTTKIEKGLSLPHPTGIIFGEYAEVGKNCTIYQNVTIGAKVRFEYKLKKYPHIGDDCTIFAGACVLGNIHLGNNTTIGCNSVITKDTEEGSTYVGISRRVK